MSDSNWEVRHSTSGYTFNVNKCTVSWASKKQPTIALSSMEAELVATTEAAKEAVYLDSFVKELGVPQSSLNRSTCRLTIKPQSTQATTRKTTVAVATSSASTTLFEN